MLQFNDCDVKMRPFGITQKLHVLVGLSDYREHLVAEERTEYH